MYALNEKASRRVRVESQKKEAFFPLFTQNPNEKRFTLQSKDDIINTIMGTFFHRKKCG